MVKLKGIFFGKVIPKKINIWEDCSLPLRDPIPGSIPELPVAQVRHRHSRLDLL